MKNLIIILIVFVCSNSFWAKKHAKKESNLKHSYEEYVRLYGDTDTSRAIIELFFDKRQLSASGKMSFLGLSLGVALIVPPIGIGLVGVSSPLFISGIVTRKRYNHKNLRAVLEQFNKNGELPMKIEKQVKLILAAENEEYEEVATLKRKMALRSIGRNAVKENAVLVVN